MQWPILRATHIASVQPPPFARQNFLPLSSWPTQVCGAVQSPSVEQANAQSRTPPFVKQSYFGLIAAHSAVPAGPRLQAGFTQAPLTQV